MSNLWVSDDNYTLLALCTLAWIEIFFNSTTADFNCNPAVMYPLCSICPPIYGFARPAKVLQWAVSL